MLPVVKSVVTLTALFISGVFAVQNVAVKGQDFINTVTNERVMIIGIDYQPGGQGGFLPGQKDPLTNGTECLRDAALIQQLGVNTIRVYNVDPSLNHDDCASIFNAIGVYMIIDVNSPLQSLDRMNPKDSYNKDYLSRVFGVIENFKDYPNTLGFFAGNEIMNSVATGDKNPPYIRAVQRDMKNYIAKHAKRAIPVGYSAADVRDILQDTWAYLQCNIDGKQDQSRSDFFGLNSYSWCGESNFQKAGYDLLVNMFAKTTIPVFFSEYGCNTVRPGPRPFTEVPALYGNQMTALSGGLVYEYSEEESDYGVVKINSNSTVSLLKDYDNLQSNYNKLDTKLLQTTQTNGTDITPPTCSKSLITASGFSNSFDIPDAPDGVSDLINNGIQNPNNGKIVQVKETAVPMAVYDSKGQEMKGLAIKSLPDDQSNTPGQQTSNPSGTGTGSASANPTHKGTASKATATQGLLLVIAMGVLLML